MTKISLVIGLLIVIFTISFFGGKMGYTVEGVPAGEDAVLYREYEDWREANYGLDVTFEFWREQFEDSGVAVTVLTTLEFMKDMTFFRIDGVPDWVAVIFLIMNIMTGILILMFVRGN